VRRLIALSLTMLLTVGCAVGPNYKRPSAEVPGAYRGAASQEVQQPAAESLGDQKWWEVFQDKQLQDLIHTALQQNYDVALQQRESWKPGRRSASHAPTGCRRLVPELSLSINALRAKNSSRHLTQAHTRWISHGLGSRFLGKYRRANESARASLLATQWAREAVISTLVSDVAAAYFSFVSSTCSSKSPGAR